MYAWLWRHLPGPAWGRVIIALVAVLAVTAICFVWVFPAVTPMLPFDDNVVSH